MPSTLASRAWIAAIFPFACACAPSPAAPSTPRQSPVELSAATPREIVRVDASDTKGARPFRHFWETTFGSGRSILSLRESYRRDLRAMRASTGIAYVRFHDILHDDVGVYDEDANGKPVYNFTWVDQIYDGLLDNGVRPYVEIGFMPKKLAASPITLPFWYAPHTAPPKSWDAWSALVTAFITHLVERYGIDEVAAWYFEVWNEPNLPFWAGEPKEETYYELYDRTARAIAAVSPRLRVGGPATAQAAWIDRFIQHAVEKNVPLHFVSTHVYANDDAKAVLGKAEAVPREAMVCRAARKVFDQVRASRRPDLPIVFSEFNATYLNETSVTDAPYMAPWIADTVRQCDGLVDAMSFWTFSDVFDEQGVTKEPFYGGYGLIAEGGIPKPSFHAFALLHRLGETRLASASTHAIVTRRQDGALAIATWTFGAPLAIDLRFEHLPPSRTRARIARVDAQHGNALAAYDAMGRPRYPTRAQLDALRRAAELPSPEEASLEGGTLHLTLPPNAFALVEVPRGPE